MFFQNSCFFDDPVDVGNLISDSSAFSKTSLYIWKFMVYVLLKRGLENFEHYFISMWDECNCVVVWAFFGIAFLWDWNENWPFPVLWPLLSFPHLLAYWVQHFHSIIFQDLKQLYWNSITSTSFVQNYSIIKPSSNLLKGWSSHIWDELEVSKASTYYQYNNLFSRRFIVKLLGKMDQRLCK